MDWLSLWALAVNEENASGGRVVTAPTNGAAGIIPSVLKFALTYLQDADEGTVVDFLAHGGADRLIYQQSASSRAPRSAVRRGAPRVRWPPPDSAR